MSHTGQKHWTDAYRQIIISIAVVLVVLIVAAVIITVALLRDPPNAGESNDSTTADTLSTEDRVYTSVVLKETPDAGKAYQDKLTFVGDTTTAHMISRAVLSDGALTQQVWRTRMSTFNLNADAAQTKIIHPVSKQEMTVADAAGDIQPEILIMTLGADWGVAYLSEAEFAACYMSLVQAVKKASPHTTVILQSIFPVTADCSNPLLTNEKIDTCNSWVQGVAYACGCPYLDTQSVLKGADNALKTEFAAAGSGLYLSEEGYAAVLQYIRTHAYVK